MKTLPVMIRVEPKRWQALQREASKRDRTTPQLVREIINEWLTKVQVHTVRRKHDVIKAKVEFENANRTHNDDD